MERQKYHTGLLALSILFGIIFAVNFLKNITYNWSFDAFPYVIIFTLLAEVYFSTRKLIYSGMMFLGIFLIGMLFKVSHWPGTSFLLIVSTLGLISIPFINAFSTNEQRILNLVISTWLLISGSGYLFSIIHWSISKYLVAASRFYLPILAATLIFTLGQHKSQRDDRNI